MGLLDERKGGTITTQGFEQGKESQFTQQTHDVGFFLQMKDHDFSVPKVHLPFCLCVNFKAVLNQPADEDDVYGTGGVFIINPIEPFYMYGVGSGYM